MNTPPATNPAILCRRCGDAERIGTGYSMCRPCWDLEQKQQRRRRACKMILHSIGASFLLTVGLFFTADAAVHWMDSRDGETAAAVMGLFSRLLWAAVAIALCVCQCIVNLYPLRSRK